MSEHDNDKVRCSGDEHAEDLLARLAADPTMVLTAHEHRVVTDYHRRRAGPLPLAVRDAVAAHPAAPLALIASPDMNVLALPSTLPRDRDGVKRRLNAMGQSTLELDRDGCLLIEAADVLAYWRRGEPDEEGRVEDYSWLVLIDSAGETFGTSSHVVAEKVGKLLACRSAGLVEWPCPLQIVTRTARKTGRRYHDVIVL